MKNEELIEKLRAELAFYANPSHYQQYENRGVYPNESPWPAPGAVEAGGESTRYYIPAVMADAGKRARAVLEMKAAASA